MQKPKPVRKQKPRKLGGHLYPSVGRKDKASLRYISSTKRTIRGSEHGVRVTARHWIGEAERKNDWEKFHRFLKRKGYRITSSGTVVNESGRLLTQIQMSLLQRDLRVARFRYRPEPKKK